MRRDERDERRHENVPRQNRLIQRTDEGESVAAVNHVRRHRGMHHMRDQVHENRDRTGVNHVDIGKEEGQRSD